MNELHVSRQVASYLFMKSLLTSILKLELEYNLASLARRNSFLSNGYSSRSCGDTKTLTKVITG